MDKSTYELQKQLFEVARERKLATARRMKTQIEEKIGRLQLKLQQVEADIEKKEKASFPPFPDSPDQQTTSE